MLSSCVLSIGREIITGAIKDTNSFYLSSNLTAIGIYNRFILSVDDVKDDIINCFVKCLKEVDIVVTTGGLGPTFDDITLPSISEALNRELVLSEQSYKRIKQFYEKLFEEGKIDSREMNEKRKKMAYIPENSIELNNIVGAASGVYIQEDSKHIFCLPGVPREMKPMFENEVFPILKGLSRGVILSKTYEFGINDETIIGQLIDKVRVHDVYIKSLPTGFDSKTMGVRFTANGENEKECMKKIVKVKNMLEQLLS